VSWASLALVALTGAGVVTYYSYEKGRRVEGAPSCLKKGSGTELEAAAAVLTPISAFFCARSGAGQDDKQNGW